MDWLDRLSKFHSLNGRRIEKYPVLEDGSILLYYNLRQTVQSMGGFTQVSKLKLWDQVAERMKLAGRGEFLYISYVTVIWPFEKFLGFMEFVNVKDGECRYKNCDLHKTKEQYMQFLSTKVEEGVTLSSREMEYFYDLKVDLPVSPPRTPHVPKTGKTLKIERNEVEESPSSKRVKTEHGSRNVTKNVSYKETDEEEEDQEGEEEEHSERGFVTICEICEQACLKDECRWLQCNECSGLFHKACVSQSEVFVQPTKKTTWYCSRCLVGSCEFMFEPGKVYSLGDFQHVADKFKENYEKEHPELQSYSSEQYENEIEKRFWDYVNTTGKSVTVEYGSDIHCSEKGSGFPMKGTDTEYANDTWNLNNIPLHKDSLFNQIRSDISGMTVPWLYVGMMFSTFCWHSEDHYTYSVNYQHFGATKTWYGIPGSDAEKFEQAMQDAVPSLFHKQPNLLFQLVTMISPEVLIKNQVSCYAVDQGPGEFVITFPKAYHAGFNHGFNCNEAVNFAPPDWVPYGSESVVTYRRYKRPPVFSNDALLVRTAMKDSRAETARWLEPFIEDIVTREIKLRGTILAKLNNLKPRVCNREPKTEEEYQCAICNALPYLSRIEVTPLNDRALEQEWGVVDDEKDGMQKIVVCLEHVLDRKCVKTELEMVYMYTNRVLNGVLKGVREALKVNQNE